MESPEKNRNPAEGGYAALLAELGRAERRHDAGRLRAALARVAGVFLPALALVFIANLVFPDAVRGLARGGVLLLAAAVAISFLHVLRSARRRAPREVALLIGRHDERLGRDLLSAIDLWALRGEGAAWYSRDLLNAAIDARVSRLSGVRLDQTLHVPPPRRWLLSGAVGVGAALLAVLLSPPDAGRIALGMMSFGKGPLEPAPRQIVVEPGDCRVLAGDPLTLRASFAASQAPPVAAGSKGSPQDLWVEILDENATQGGAAGRAGGGEEDALRRQLMNPASDASAYDYTFTRVLRPFRYRVRGEDAESPVYRVDLTERPRLTDLELAYHYPDYTGEPVRRVAKSDGRIIALRGTRVEVRAHASVPLASARLDFGEGHDPLAMEVEPASSGAPAGSDGDEEGGASGAARQNGEHGEAHTEFVLDESGEYRIRLTSADGYQGLPTEARPIVVLEDEDPYVRLLSPAADVTLNRDLNLPLTVSAVDDYGLGAMTLHYEIALAGADASQPPEKGEEQLADGRDGSRFRRELEVDHEWDLSRLDLGPGDVVSYWVTVVDNDAIRGPKEASTPVFQARFPTLEEVFAQVTEDEEEGQKTLEEISAQERDVHQKLDELSREALRKDDLDWEDKQKLEQTLDRQRMLQEKMEEVVSSLSQAAQQSEERELLSPEAVDRLMELQRLLSEVATPEMRAAMDRFQQSMSQNLSPEQMSQAMNELMKNQDQFVKRLERAIALLKRFQQEQKLEAMVARAEELLQRQADLLKAMESAESEGEMSKLANKEERVSAETEALKKEAEELAEELQSSEPDAAQSLEEASQGLEEEETLQELNNASQQLAQSHPQQAQKSGRKGHQGLQNMRDRLAMAQNQFMESLRQEIMAELGTAAQELLVLSLDEENLVDRLENDPRDRDLARGLADTQQDLMSGLHTVTDRLMKLGEKTLFVNSDIARNMGSSLLDMQGALDQLTSGQARAAGEHGDRSVVSLNQALIDIRRSQQQASSCQSPTGLPQMMETLSSASCQQAGVNQQSQSLKEGMTEQPGGKMSPQASAEMGRLSAQQRAISEALRQALDEQAKQSGAGRGDGVLGRLDEALKEMEQTVNDLMEGRLTDQTLERQEHILSRLLDAQRSVRRREYSQERRSQTARSFETKSPDQLARPLLEKPAEVREDLLRSVTESYPPEYESLIREYFRALRSEDGT